LLRVSHTFGALVVFEFSYPNPSQLKFQLKYGADKSHKMTKNSSDKLEIIKQTLFFTNYTK